ncbi:TetR/AcrR family transcriptional regulator C-terminal domain-containing protein [Actinomadura sp. DC4]|uniref:TetR/AcrR family transcriptional regulator C-terminal domain-containing protein n=1 Tax=Actinomadura sp. DC4 TaxID=3055069 RepID=UPI0025AF3EA3|nr:TetR/AcrR family transcriptional regulator C-terminal domain-containing protein [Actinomadura sp. DC4]MDN3352846.1 TetR/AcrR family transcriptional regulator C-terminal domain-containing protein [Actinomadura sp. DC4]
MALDRETVLDTALRIIDEVGLDGLSLRRLAKELGVQAPALYWHFSSKKDLLDHLVALVNERAESGTDGPAPGQSWDEWLAEGMRMRRRSMLAQRDGARLTAGNRPTADSRPRIERTLGVLVAAGFTPQDAIRAVLVLGHYVSGFVMDEQFDADREDDEPQDLGDFPIMLAGGRAALDRDTLFEYGLQRMLDGMRAQLSVRPR